MARVTHVLLFCFFWFFSNVWRKCVRIGLKVDVNKMNINTLNVVFVKCLFKNTAQDLMSELHVGFVKKKTLVEFKYLLSMSLKKPKTYPSWPSHQANNYTLKTTCLGSCTMC